MVWMVSSAFICWSGLETGKVSCEAGPRMASGDYVTVDITGKGGHGSMPSQGSMLLWWRQLSSLTFRQ